MSSAISFADYLYGRLPDIYRTADNGEKTQLILYRFLQTMDEAGFVVNLSDIEAIFDLSNLSVLDDGLLPYYAGNVAFVNDSSIPFAFLRTLLNNIIRVYKMAGVDNCVKFLVREMTGFYVTLTPVRVPCFRYFLADTMNYSTYSGFRDIDSYADSTMAVRSDGRTVVKVEIEAPEEDASLIVKQEALNIILERFRPVHVIYDGVYILNSSDESDNLLLESEENLTGTEINQNFAEDSDYFIERGDITKAFHWNSDKWNNKKYFTQYPDNQDGYVDKVV